MSLFPKKVEYPFKMTVMWLKNKQILTCKLYSIILCKKEKVFLFDHLYI